jgi:sterol 14-demethylase
MIAALQGSVYKDGKELTNRDIAHMMIAILMAGQHTSSATSSWTLLHIAHRPDIAYVSSSLTFLSIYFPPYLLSALHPLRVPAC